MKPASADMVFLMPLEKLANLEVTGDKRILSQAILDLITSHFPASCLKRLKSQLGNPPGLACNQFLTADGLICMNLLVSRKSSLTEPYRCSLISWFLPHYFFFRPWYKPTERDSKLVKELHEKVTFILDQKLDATEIDHFQSEEEFLAKYPEFR